MKEMDISFFLQKTEPSPLYVIIETYHYVQCQQFLNVNGSPYYVFASYHGFVSNHDVPNSFAVINVLFSFSVANASADASSLKEITL